jgi:hypothetical protein
MHFLSRIVIVLDLFSNEVSHEKRLVNITLYFGIINTRVIFCRLYFIFCTCLSLNIVHVILFLLLNYIAICV